MQTDFSKKNLKRIDKWAGQLACPVCFGTIHIEAAHVTCAGCGRVYPVVDGIPVLIAERAEKNTK